MSVIAGLGASNFSAAAMLPVMATPALGAGPKAAREFEAHLIGTVLESLEKSFASIPGNDAVAGEDDYNYLGTQALSSAIANGGGFGIARMISEHLSSRSPISAPPSGTKVAGGPAASSSADSTKAR